MVRIVKCEDQENLDMQFKSKVVQGPCELLNKPVVNNGLR